MSMTYEAVVAEINRQLSMKRFPSGLIEYLRILEKRQREHGF